LAVYNADYSSKNQQKMNRTYLFLVLLSIFTACKNNKIVRPSDYNVFLSDNHVMKREIEKINSEIKFWQKRLSADTGNYVDMQKLASNFIKRFKVSGFADDLHTADSFYTRCLAKIKYTQPEMFFSISQNAITQHRFQDAWRYLQLADSIGVNPYVIKLLKFDAAMEIGLYQQAEYNLQQVKNEKEFDYLIRKAKLEDHYGRLDKAIEFMEIALEQSNVSGKKENILWSKSNLADMYGHAGRIKDAYKNYLEVLSVDSTYLYALKGIAWIAYSHDKNTEEAKRIIEYISRQANMPDHYLILAEIAEWEGDLEMKKQCITNFITEVEKPVYGNMYNKYLITIYTEDLKNFDKAMAIAEKEVNCRPTPETYDWLAWVYYQQGDVHKAYDLIEKFVLGKTSEPDALLHAAIVQNEYGKKSDAKKILIECKESSFELGPLTTQKINSLL
jgi:tetratricopeptide (TPR) repeat protein